jgi:NADPH2:quinone reductase
VLVTGATGAVGLVAVQLAKLVGARRVVAAGRDRGRLERALSLGADATVELGDGLEAEQLRERFAEAAGGRLDVALDPLWGEPARAAIEALTRDGVYVSFGQAASPVAELSGIPMRNRRVALVGHSGAWATPQERQAALARAHELAARSGGQLTLDTEELALEEIGDAWERLSSSAGRRLVVKP